MRVRILTAAPGFPSGSLADLDEATAAAWVGTGRAERVSEPVRQVEAEQATAEPEAVPAMEQAVTYRRQRRGR